MSVTQLITKVYFINKGSSSNKVTLVENDAIIINDRVISKTMNRFFIKIKTIKKPNLKPFKMYVSERFKGVSQISKQVNLILARYP